MLYFIKPIFKKVGGLTTGVCLLLVLCLLAGGNGRCQTTRPATIMATALNVRARPDIGADRITTLPQGTRVTVHEYINGWLKISWQDRTGYIRNKKEYIHVEGTPEELEALKSRAEQISREIKSHQTDLEKIGHQETSLMDRLNELARSLQQAEQNIGGLRKKIKKLETNIATNREAAAVLENRIAEKEEYATRRLVALYKLSLLGEMNVLGAADSVYDFLKTKRDISYIYRHDRQMLDTFRANRARLTELTATLLAEKNKKKQLEQRLQREIAAMAAEKAERNHLLAEIREKEALRRAAIKSLKQDARALDDTIASLYVKPDRGKELPGNFSARKGLLKPPVNGKIITKFGKYRNEELNIVNFRSGIDIRASQGEPIKAVFRGQVLYATWFKGYGNMIIIDHGDSYYTVYAHAQELFKKKGDYVATNEVIATVGDTASISEGPSLYFEVRHKGQAIDPTLWLQTG